MSSYIQVIDGEIHVVIPLNDQVDTTEMIEVPSLPSMDAQPAWLLVDNGGVFNVEVDQDKLLQLQRQSMPRLTPIEFDIKLNNAGLYDTVQELIKDNFEMRIAYNRATFFSRIDPFIDQARIALNLTDEQVDMIWVQQDRQLQQ